MKKTARPAKAIRPTPAPAPAPAAPAGVPESPASETVLLAVVGMSPAILTETLWALAHPADGTEPVIPHRVIAVTTTQGRDKLAALFAPSAQLGGVAPWDALRAALQAEGHDLTGRLRFGNTADDLRVITAADPATGRSRELADIRDRADNEAAADFLLEQVRAIVENPDTRLIASVAGGRKTMSALLYACLTLVGRETDRLTHVLVSEPFETLRDFWFPAQPGGPLPTRSVPSVGSVSSVPSVSPASAILDLADVPFVPPPQPLSPRTRHQTRQLPPPRRKLPHHPPPAGRHSSSRDPRHRPRRTRSQRPHLQTRPHRDARGAVLGPPRQTRRACLRRLQGRSR